MIALRFSQKIVMSLLIVLTAGLIGFSAYAQTTMQYMPVLTFRTGPYAPNGIPIANGIVDYLKLVNARGGINGVTLRIEECETGYDTARSVECYERTKNLHGGAAIAQLWSTGALFAIMEKAQFDQIPLVTYGYGRGESSDGSVFKWNFPIAGTYWVATDVVLQAIGAREGGMDKLKGKKIALVYHDSPYGKESIPVAQVRAAMHGFHLMELPVSAPGVEQKSTWLQIRQARVDYVILWGFGVMNSTALKEAQATGFRRDRMYGSWWAGAEPDVRDAGQSAQGYNAVALQSSAGFDAKVVKEVLATLYDQGLGTGAKEDVGSVLWTRGATSAMLAVEAIRTAQARFGKGQVMTGTQVRWGLENLNLTQAHLESLGFTDLIRPIATTCFDHMGSRWARISTWDGTAWRISSDWMEADAQILAPLTEQAAVRYAAERKLVRRAQDDCDA